MPAVEPVTRAVFPERSMIMRHLLLLIRGDIGGGGCARNRDGITFRIASPPRLPGEYQDPYVGQDDGDQNKKAALGGAAFETLDKKRRFTLLPLPSPRPGRNPCPWHRRRGRRTRSPPSRRCR